MMPSNRYLHPSVFVYLLFLKFFHPKLNKKIGWLDFPPADLVSELGKTYPTNLAAQNALHFHYMELLLLFLYYNDYNKKYTDSKPLTKRDETTGKYRLTYKLTFSDFYLEDEIVDQLHRVRQEYRSGSILFFLERIDLIRSFSQT